MVIKFDNIRAFDMTASLICKHLFLLLLISLVTVVSVKSQDYLAYNGNEIVLNDQVYKESIHTTLLYVDGSEISEPYLELRGEGALRLRFDELESGFGNYYYSVIHCTSDWYRSDLDQSEYMDGFYENYVSDYEQSFNTTTDFVHYTALFPNEQSRLTKSGNYLLLVYEDGDMDQVVLTKRFVVYEQLVVVDAHIHESNDPMQKRYRQEVDFTISHEAYNIPNPYSDLTVCVLQNNRWDNALCDLEPVFVKGTELTYDYNGPNEFDGLNEYRNFDLKNLEYLSLQVDSIQWTRSGWNAWLVPRPARGFLTYSTYNDINGQFIIRNDRGFEHHLESDYVTVIFNLKLDTQLSDVGIYVYGKLSNNQIDGNYKMKYNFNTRSYEARLLLKQGFYDYSYAIQRPESEAPDFSLTEGSHSQTRNDYTFFVYNYEIAGDYDRVVGVLFTDSYNGN